MEMIFLKEENDIKKIIENISKPSLQRLEVENKNINSDTSNISITTLKIK
nr:MAG TPA: hypothetical protein [Caudoviricetes sp.]